MRNARPDLRSRLLLWLLNFVQMPVLSHRPLRRRSYISSICLAKHTRTRVAHIKLLYNLRCHCIWQHTNCSPHTRCTPRLDHSLIREETPEGLKTFHSLHSPQSDTKTLQLRTQRNNTSHASPIRLRCNPKQENQIIICC